MISFSYIHFLFCIYTHYSHFNNYCQVYSIKATGYCKSSPNISGELLLFYTSWVGCIMVRPAELSVDTDIFNKEEIKRIAQITYFPFQFGIKIRIYRTLIKNTVRFLSEIHHFNVGIFVKSFQIAPHNFCPQGVKGIEIHQRHISNYQHNRQYTASATQKNFPCKILFHKITLSNHKSAQVHNFHSYR